MTSEEAIEMIKARKKCLESGTSGRQGLCSNDCDDCDLNYIQGNMGEQIEWLGMAIKALEKQDSLDVYIKQILWERDIAISQLEDIGMSLGSKMDEVKKALEEQDKHRWIPVSEGLPPEHDTMFAKFKGTSKWTNSMFEKMSDDVNATIELEDGTRKTTTMHTTDGEWLFGSSIVKKKVIAWRPLPDSYMGDIATTETTKDTNLEKLCRVLREAQFPDNIIQLISSTLNLYSGEDIRDWCKKPYGKELD